MLHSFPSSAPELCHTQTAALDAARKAYIAALRACDQGVRRGDEVALDGLQKDASDRLNVLQRLSQLWLQQSAQRNLLAVPDSAAQVTSDEPDR